MLDHADRHIGDDVVPVAHSLPVHQTPQGRKPNVDHQYQLDHDQPEPDQGQPAVLASADQPATVAATVTTTDVVVQTRHQPSPTASTSLTKSHR